ncbi:MAG: FAD-dependent oxidoreductase [Candidatus Enterosoma sp.]|nr:FAD-dependent oxidoreductase [Candidatus Enterosoma sp.]MDY5650095.1 FAD-dependent oxidoreductase [Candidatus Enterosoma sp.]
MSKKYTSTKKGFDYSTLSEEVSRCLLCLDAPCSKMCPASTDPAKFIRSVRFKNLQGAAETIRENNALGSICARVCPTEKYCQLGCTRSGIDRPIEIGLIQQYVTDFEREKGMEILKVSSSKDEKIAIVGSGPAGLESAALLRMKGYSVDIYEKESKLGGYLRVIPEYRLPSSIIDYEIKRITDLGVNVKLKKEVGKDISLADLKKKYDAVIVAVGYSASKTLPMFKGDKVMSATAFLREVKAKKGKYEVPDNVVVIGGGDVAMDVSTTLKKIGVTNVTDVIYEKNEELLASKEELKYARDNNVSLIDGYKPTAYKDGVITFKSRFIDATLKIKADLVILAVGQKIDNALSLPVIENEVDVKNYRVKDSNVFAVGDITSGDKTVVYAVRKGKEVAFYVDKYLSSLQGGKK